jgi:ribosomal protein S12 methylthiotransferase accessory factor
MGEAIERLSGIYRGSESRITASLSELGDSAVHPNMCMRFSDRQYRDRELWNRRHSRVNWVPRVLGEQRKIEWVALASLTQEQPRYLPASYCYFGYPASSDELYCLADSNGAAAGASLEEATVHGLLEVVERDAVAIWWYNMVRRPAVDLDRFKVTFFGAVREYLRSRGRDLWILDITTDLEIPVVVALSRAIGREQDDLHLGFGAHVSFEGAVSRALVELGQSIALTSSTGIKTRVWGDRPPALEWLEPAGDPGNEQRVPTSWPRSGDLAEDVSRLAERLQRHGLETLVLDQTRPGLGLHVVKVVVPGLRPWWARFAPGRLYEVPVQLGWLDDARQEARLSPAHLYL